MSLPYASQAQIDEMNRKAEKMAQDTQPAVEHQEPSSMPVEESLPEAPEEVSEEAQAAPQTNDREENFKNLRERTQKAERERDELLKYVQDLQKQTTNNTTSKQLDKVEEQIEELNINPEDLAEGKHLQMLYKKIKQLETQLHTSEKESRLSAAEMKIKRDFPDFEKVASYENLQKLREVDSDLADAILATKDTYKQHALAYKMVKQFGIYREDNYVKEKEIAQKNHAKPRPLNSISPQQGESPLSHANAFANGLTEELKSQLAREMYEARKKM